MSKLQQFEDCADDAYTCKDFRGTVFYATLIADQLLRYRLIKVKREAALPILNSSSSTFGNIVRILKDETDSSMLPSELVSRLPKLELLNKIRNKVCVHEAFVDVHPDDSVERQVTFDLIKITFRELAEYWAKVLQLAGESVTANTLLDHKQLKDSQNPEGVSINELMDNNFSIDGVSYGANELLNITEDIVMEPLAKFSLDLARELYSLTL